MSNSNSESIQKPVDIISGRILMGLIGILAFILPIILPIVSITIDNCGEIQKTISAYYYTDARDLMVGIICALSFAFFAYQGYSDDKSVLNDSLIGNLAAIFALGVAFFPTSIDANETSSCIGFSIMKFIAPYTMFPPYYYFLHWHVSAFFNSQNWIVTLIVFQIGINYLIRKNQLIAFIFLAEYSFLSV